MKKTTKEVKKTAEHELGLITDGSAALVRERAKQVDKGFTPQHDYENNPPGVLIAAARAILDFNVHERIANQPMGWDTYEWQKQCIKPERKRLEIAGAWVASELDRYYYAEKEEITE